MPTIEFGQGFGELRRNEREIAYEYFIVKIAIGPVQWIGER